MSSDPGRPSAAQIFDALDAPTKSPAAPVVQSAEVGSTAAPRSTPIPPPRHEEGGIKETIESILVAFILAFIFRAFVVEAFVIPTGSMAPTLMGAHMRFRCEDCGYRWDVNYTGRTVGDDVEIPNIARGKVFALFCPNCGMKVARENEADSENDATAPPVHYGDRILVLKYAYLFNDPRRWDVVVFKSPDRPDDERREVVPPYTINYIKRLIGRPGESVFILDGDIYVGPRGAAPGDHVVQTKPRAAQEALWRVIFDNDYQPTRAGWASPWRQASGGGWTVVEPTGPGGDAAAARVLSFDNAAGEGTLRFDPSPGADRQPLTDWLAYAVTRSAGSGDSYDYRVNIGRNNVSDLKLSLFYDRRGGDGPLRLQLTKLGTTFTAELTPGRARLLKGSGDDGTGAELAGATLPATRQPLRVEFMNVDYQVTLRVNGADLLRTTPQDYHPDMDRLLAAYRRNDVLPKAEVRIGAAGQACALSHVSLWRDVYYTNREPSGPPMQWGTPDSPIQLDEREFWVLGDNSLMSGDGRYWGMPVDLPGERLAAKPGVVPERFLLGKAFFVYWPAGYRLDPRAPGIVPNFGEMRFIH